MPLVTQLPNVATGIKERLLIHDPNAESSVSLHTVPNEVSETRVLGDVEKDCFVALPNKKGTQQACASKPVSQRRKIWQVYSSGSGWSCY